MTPLTPNELMKLYPIEKLSKMSEDEATALAKEFIESIVFYTSDKDGARKEIDAVLTNMIKCKSGENSSEK